MLVIVCAVLASLVQAIIMLMGINWMIGRERKRISGILGALQHEWLEHAEGQPHKLSQAIEAMGAVVGSAAARSIMASLNADASHAARAANIASDGIEGARNPLLGLLAGGKRGKGAAVLRLAELLGPMLGSGGNREADNHSIADRIGR
jgi:hypothetical protein